MRELEIMMSFNINYLCSSRFPLIIQKIVHKYKQQGYKVT